MTDDIHRIHSLDDVDAYRPAPESAEHFLLSSTKQYRKYTEGEFELDRVHKHPQRLYQTCGFTRTYQKPTRRINCLTGRLVNPRTKYRLKQRLNKPRLSWREYVIQKQVKNISKTIRFYTFKLKCITF